MSGSGICHSGSWFAWSTRAPSENARPRLSTSDDPTGAAIVWPLVMLALYALAGVGFILGR
jgi:hypothetical protein